MLSPGISKIFHPALIECMTGGRAPEPHEIELLAERIWNDINGASARVAWCDLSEASFDRCRANAVAQVALGIDVSAASPVSVEPT